MWCPNFFPIVDIFEVGCSNCRWEGTDECPYEKEEKVL